MIFKPRRTTVEEEASSSTSRRIDRDLSRAAEQNYIRALMAARLKSQPMKGPVIADMTNSMYGVMESTARGARGMGIAAPNPTRPETRNRGGIRGIATAPIHRDAVEMLPKGYTDDVDAFYRELTKALNGARK